MTLASFKELEDFQAAIECYINEEIGKGYSLEAEASSSAYESRGTSDFREIPEFNFED